MPDVSPFSSLLYFLFFFYSSRDPLASCIFSRLMLNHGWRHILSHASHIPNYPIFLKFLFLYTRGETVHQFSDSYPIVDVSNQLHAGISCLSSLPSAVQLGGVEEALIKLKMESNEMEDKARSFIVPRYSISIPYSI